MANNRFEELMADSKNRMLFVIGGAVVLIIIMYFIFSGDDKSSLDDVAGRSSISAVSTNLSGTPGLGEQSKQYQDITYKNNEKRSLEARKQGQSAVPTLVGDQVSGESIVKQLQERKKKQNEADADRRYRELVERRRQQKLLAQQRAQQAAQVNTQQAGKRGQEKLMEKQAKALFALWGAPPQMRFMKGSPLKVENTTGSSGTTGASGTDTSQNEHILYKAGDIVFAVIDTAINSDEPGPVMGRIVQGPLSGAKILGKFNPASGYDAQKLSLSFSLMNIPGLERSVSFAAIAIDPETARTAIATDVDNHYLLRYGSLLASSFLEGMSDAVLASLENSGVEQQNGAFVVSTVKSTTRDQIISGLGKIGQKIGEKSDYFDRPPTITIDAGTGIGLLITSDFNLAAPPASNYDLTSRGPMRRASSAGVNESGLSAVAATTGQVVDPESLPHTH